MSSSSFPLVSAILFRIRRQVEHLRGKVLDEIVHDVLVPDAADHTARVVHHRNVPESAALHQSNRLADGVGLR